MRETDLENFSLYREGEEMHWKDFPLTQQRLEILKLVSKLREGQINHPKDIVEEWKRRPEINESTREMEFRLVQMSNVIGTRESLLDRLEPQRFYTILKLIYFDLFDAEGDTSHGRPSYYFIDGWGYVAGDGIHRTLACKAVDIDKVYAKVQYRQ